MVQILGAELLQVAEAAAREKGIDREEVLDAMEQAIVGVGATAGKKLQEMAVALPR